MIIGLCTDYNARLASRIVGYRLTKVTAQGDRKVPQGNKL